MNAEILKSKMRRAIITITCWITILCFAHAQTAASKMHLRRTQSGHYAFSTLLNDRVMTSVMIESGMHIALIDSAFAHTYRHELGLKILPNDMNKEINLGGSIYSITHRAKGALKMGNSIYDGEFLVLAHYKDEVTLTIPIQRLRHSDTWNSHIVMLDLENGDMRMLTRKELSLWKCSRYKMNRRSYMRMPAIKTTITTTIGEETRELAGNFNIDLGNPMLLYLRAQSNKVNLLLNETSSLKISKGYTNKSDTSVRIFRPSECHILNRRFDTPTICITDKLQRFTTDGLIGLPFLMGRTVAFDFNYNYLYIKD